jgi:hypothetical protein
VQLTSANSSRASAFAQTSFRAFVNCGAPFGLLAPQPACPAGTFYTGPDATDLTDASTFATICCRMSNSVCYVVGCWVLRTVHATCLHA